MKKKFEAPKVEQKSQAEVDAIIDAINASNLTDSVKKFAINCIRLTCWFPTLLEKKDISLRRLKEMIFGKKKKRKKSNSDNDDNSSSGDGGSDNNNTPSSDGHSLQTLATTSLIPLLLQKIRKLTNLTVKIMGAIRTRCMKMPTSSGIG